eukprot:CAMPEP_0119505948 /NCGR_PEP_ID=MMETSP1344-20130328/26350_1 /TAXON_ID=236787 /ORGANISM="Florenciella parvula, Strain CCMP2471" /LENGTH=36 /DNA_ID= /DNA_START= /DNA_END= /DNA_ORIENTATION=
MGEPDVWDAKVNKRGYTYWENRRNGALSWEPPTGAG